jgi:copper chaperone CopZ
MKRLVILFVAFLGVAGLASPVLGQEKKKNYEEVEIKTSAVCGMCEERIEKGIAFEKGVKMVELNDETKVVTIGYDPRKTDAAALRTAISDLGYDADDVPADKKAHDKLPACCQKGNAAH